MSDTVPDLAEPIVGYRFWRIWDDRLVAHMTSFVWPMTGVVEAECTSGRTPVCTPAQITADARRSLYSGKNFSALGACGFYGFKELSTLIEEGHGWQFSDVGLVGGEVYLWGRVMEHARGWRAQYAQIKTLYRVHCRNPLPFASVMKATVYREFEAAGGIITDIEV